MEIQSSKIKSFSIYGLFGTNDVHIPFDKSIKILVGENGIGKTQILNIFYYSLTRNSIKLREFSFDRIELNIGNEPIIFSRKKVIEYVENIHESPIIQKTRREIIRREIIRSARQEIIRRRKWPPHKSEKKLSQNLSDFFHKIKESLSPDNILYFPTFRRVEEDLHNLGYDEEKFLTNKDDNNLIHFGMDDVQQRFHAIERKIDLLLKEGLNKISSEILSKLVMGFPKIDKAVLDRINEADINIILARAGNEISEQDKAKIREIVQSKKIEDEAEKSLFYFLQILVDIYEKQKELDNSINKFKEVCNNYLINKKVFYDESKIKIYIKSDGSEELLPLSKLSSGEKQIISIFSKIYLSEVNQSFIVLFDEPELSLSIVWQRKLLPDIVNSGKCSFLLAVTHSPFIFENELDDYAIGLNEYLRFPTSTRV